jgi:hypothetical protein
MILSKKGDLSNNNKHTYKNIYEGICALKELSTNSYNYSLHDANKKYREKLKKVEEGKKLKENKNIENKLKKMIINKKQMATMIINPSNINNYKTIKNKRKEFIEKLNSTRTGTNMNRSEISSGTVRNNPFTERNRK